MTDPIRVTEKESAVAIVLCRVVSEVSELLDILSEDFEASEVSKVLEIS